MFEQLIPFLVIATLKEKNIKKRLEGKGTKVFC